MAAVTVTRARPCSPPGYEVNDKVVLSGTCVAGDLLTYTGNTVGGQAEVVKAPTSGITEAHGIALRDGYAGEAGFDMGVQGEMDGFSGLTPGAPLYPSTATAGKIDTSAIANATARIRAVRATRIRYNFV